MIGTKGFENYCVANFEIAVNELEKLYLSNDETDATFPLTIKWVLNFIRCLDKKPIHVLAILLSNGVNVDGIIRDTFAFVEEYRKADGKISPPKFGSSQPRVVGLVRRIAVTFFNDDKDALISAALVQLLTEKYLDTLPKDHADRDILGNVRSLELCDGLKDISFNVIEVDGDTLGRVKAPDVRLN